LARSNRYPSSVLAPKCSLAFVFALTLAACGPAGGTDGGGETGSEESESTSTSTTSTSESDSSSETAQIPDCTPGAFGCTCAEGDACSPDLACVDGMCTFSDCSPGYYGCPCDAGDACNDGLFCVEGTCFDCLPGELGCQCNAGSCDNGIECLNGECWLPSPYPNCGWIDGNDYYYCGSNIATPEHPIECPPMLVAGEPCPPDLDFIGCCDEMGAWWCQDGMIATQPC